MQSKSEAIFRNNLLDDILNMINLMKKTKDSLL